VGVPERGRLRPDAVGPFTIHEALADFLKFLVPALKRHRRLLGDRFSDIPDFTRFARSQRQEVIGQALALPTTMTLYSLIGILVTSATVVIYGTAIGTRFKLLSRFTRRGGVSRWLRFCSPP